MSRICDLSGKRTSSGSNVSHSNAHTKRTFKPNLQEKGFMSNLLGRIVKLRLATSMIRTVDKFGGLDGYMVNVKNRRVIEDFSLKATRLRKEILKAAPQDMIDTKLANKKPVRAKVSAKAEATKAKKAA